MAINLICIGKIKESYLQEGILEYQKRLKPFCDFKIMELKEFNTTDIEKNILEEEKLILNSIKDQDFVITLEILGRNLSSEELASKIHDTLLYTSFDISFVIGGSNGLGKRVLQRSNFALSFGRNTYPHQLMRLIFVEQLYRSFMINNNTKYHK